MTEFTTWRSLVDGEKISAIPDSIVYLHDDWGDNKLTDRDGSETTTYNGVEGVYRPEWATISGLNTPTVQNERLEIDDGDGIETDLNLNLDETITWELSNIDVGNTGISSNHANAILFSEQNEDFNSAEFPHNSYLVIIRGGGDDVVLQEVDGSGDNSVLARGGELTDSHDITVIREPNGDWELFVDGSSVGSATDASHTNPNHAMFTAESQRDIDVSIDEIKVS